MGRRLRPSSGRGGHRVTFAIVTVGVAAYAMMQSLVMPVLPTIQAALHTTQSQVTWVLTTFLLSASVFTPIVGRLGDLYGKKRMFVIALCALAVGSLIAALAPSLAVMIVARVIQGIGGGVLPLAFGIIRDQFDSAEVPGAIGVIAALSSVGAGVGVVLAGPIVDILSYQWLFWIPLIAIACAATAAYVCIPESPTRAAGTVNWVGALLLSAWLVLLLFALSRGPLWGWGSTAIVTTLCGAVVALCAWIAAEMRAACPLVDMRMMRRRNIWVANVIALLMGIGLYAALGFLPQFLQTPPRAGYGFGATVTTSGLMLLPMTLGMFVLGLCSGRLVARVGARCLIVGGCLISAAGYLGVAVTHEHQLAIYLAMAAVGTGFGMAFTAMSNVVVAAVPADQTGVASGMNTNIRTVGGSIGAALMASIIAGSTSGRDDFPTESGYTVGFLVLGVAVGAGAVVAMFLPSSRGPTSPQRKSVSIDSAPAISSNR